MGLLCIDDRNKASSSGENARMVASSKKKERDGD